MAHPYLDALLNVLLPFAQQCLQKRGEFVPFGATVRQDETIQLAAGYTGSESASSQEIISLLERGFAEDAQHACIRAVGVCVDCRVVPPGHTQKTDAICCFLEHENGEACEVFMPYRKGPRGKVEFGELFAARGQPKTFGAARPRSD